MASQVALSLLLGSLQVHVFFFFFLFFFYLEYMFMGKFSSPELLTKVIKGIKMKYLYVGSDLYYSEVQWEEKTSCLAKSCGFALLSLGVHLTV